MRAAAKTGRPPCIEQITARGGGGVDGGRGVEGAGMGVQNKTKTN